MRFFTWKWDQLALEFLIHAQVWIYVPVTRSLLQWGSRKKLPDTRKNSEVAVSTSGCVKICSKTWIILVMLELADSHCDPERQEANTAFTFSGQLWIQPKPRSYFHQRALHWLCSVSSGSHQYTNVVWIRTENGWEKCESLPLVLCSLGLWWSMLEQVALWAITLNSHNTYSRALCLPSYYIHIITSSVQCWVKTWSRSLIEQETASSRQKEMMYWSATLGYLKYWPCPWRHAARSPQQALEEIWSVSWSSELGSDLGRQRDWCVLRMQCLGSACLWRCSDLCDGGALTVVLTDRTEERTAWIL